MISIIIPIMPIGTYPGHMDNLLKALDKQINVEKEIIIERQQPSEFIYKNKLLNQGFEKAKGEFIWHCDADFMPNENDLLYRMRQKLVEDDIDVIFPMYYSGYRYWKASDGGPFMKREVLELHGPLDASLRGVSNVTMPFAAWCLDNVKYLASLDFTIGTQKPTFRGKKICFDTWRANKPYMVKFLNTLTEKGMNKIKPDAERKRQANMP